MFLSIASKVTSIFTLKIDSLFTFITAIKPRQIASFFLLFASFDVGIENQRQNILQLSACYYHQLLITSIIVGILLLEGVLLDSDCRVS